MTGAFSTPRNRIKTYSLLAVCGLLAAVAAVIGIDDHPPGVLLAFLAATAFILSFAHPWRSARKFLLLVLASVLGFILFIIEDILVQSITQNPATSGTLQNLIQSPAIDVLSMILSMVFSAAFFVGIIGSIAMFICNRRRSA